eukprot:746911-Hanusia_phi.AAC.2
MYEGRKEVRERKGWGRKACERRKAGWSREGGGSLVASPPTIVTSPVFPTALCATSPGHSLVWLRRLAFGSFLRGFEGTFACQHESFEQTESVVLEMLQRKGL